MHNCLPLFFLPFSSDKLSSPADPELLTYDEIVQLYQDETPPVSVQEKLTHLLNTPFVRNTASESGVTPMKPLQANFGKILRVVEWNIERGLEFEALRFALSDSRQFNALMVDKGSKAGEEERARTASREFQSKIREEIDFLRKADVLVLNEVDWGVNRTLFRNVADELARALNMNYAYGVEFVEVDPSILLSVAITVEPSTQLTTQFQNEYPITIPLRSTCLGTTARSAGLSTRRLLQVDLHLLNGKKAVRLPQFRHRPSSQKMPPWW